MSKPMDFIKRYETAIEVFGKPMEPQFLIDRVGQIGWEGSLYRLAELAAALEHLSAEEMRQRTVDPILSLTGDVLAARGRSYAAQHRNSITIVHDEVIVFLQHLVILVGSDNDDAPDDPELSLWLLGANQFLDTWEDEDSRALAVNEELVAIQVRNRLFNTHPDRMQLIVRSRYMLRDPPADGPLSDARQWENLQRVAFGSSLEKYYSDFLMPLVAASQLWGKPRPGGVVDPPVITSGGWSTSRADPAWIQERLAMVTGTRDSLRTEIAQMLLPNGLPRAPSALRRRPFVQIRNDARIAVSPGGLRTQLYTGTWAAYLSAVKKIFGTDAFRTWSNCFGYLLETWCSGVARMAETAPAFRHSWSMKLPSKPGAPDEIEDVVLLEDQTALLFSVKSALLPERDIYRAKSRTAILDWLERFLFSQDKNFKGAVVKLDAKISKLRSGDYEILGVSRDARIGQS